MSCGVAAAVVVVVEDVVVVSLDDSRLLSITAVEDGTLFGTITGENALFDAIKRERTSAREVNLFILEVVLVSAMWSGSLNIGTFMPVLAATLKDVEDIQLQAHQIVMTMCVRQPTYMVAAVENFVEPLEKTMNRKVGTKTGTELERLIDWKKSALRTMVALSKVEGTMNSRKFAEFVERIKGNSKFRSALDAIEEER